MPLALPALALVALIVAESGGHAIRHFVVIGILAAFVWRLAITPVVTLRKLQYGVRTRATVDAIGTPYKGRASVAFHFEHEGEIVHAVMHARAKDVTSINVGDGVAACYFASNPRGAVLETLTSWELTRA